MRDPVMVDTTQFRVDDPDTLRELFELATTLATCQELQQVADLAAQASLRLLPERGVLLQLWDDATPGGLIEAYAGPEMSVHMHRETLRGRDGRLGEIVVDGLRPLTDLDRALLAMIITPTGTAAQAIIELRGHDRAQHMAVLALARLAECRDQETSNPWCSWSALRPSCPRRVCTCRRITVCSRRGRAGVMTWCRCRCRCRCR